jgi:hypothetical protein
LWRRSDGFSCCSRLLVRFRFDIVCVRLALLGHALASTAVPAGAQAPVNPGAQAPGGADERRLYDEAFRATYADPADVAAAIRFAKIAARQGDLEGAIGALERVLIFNPDLPEVGFELGMLYRALGSLETARIYLRRVDPSRLSPEDRALRERTLAELERGLSRHALTGIAGLGLRYQTNANAGALKAAQLAPGGGPPNPSLQPRADTDAFAAISVTHVYDTDDLAGDTIETRLTLYGNRQFHRHLLNTALAELDTGPRFRLGGAAAGSPTVRPYVLGNVFELGGSEYFWSGGGGVSGRMALTGRVTAEAAVETRSLSFNTTAAQPSATNKDAQQTLLRTLAIYAPSERTLLSALVQGSSYDARAPFETYKELLVTLGYTRRFAAPWTWREQPWAVTFGVSHASRWYDAPDIALDPAHTRDDSEWNLGGALIVGLAPQLDFRLEVQQIWANSNVLLYDYRNTAVLGSLELRF